ncbi:MAG: tyrosine-type recombinase/integrase [Roseicyclus sp.]
MPVVGPTYLLGIHGRPFKNGNVLGNKVQDWTREAGLENRSSHGLRKSLAELLAEQGATSHQIMSVLAHTQSKTTEIYTKGAERTRLARAAMNAIAGLRIG